MEPLACLEFECARLSLPTCLPQALPEVLWSASVSELKDGLKLREVKLSKK